MNIRFSYNHPICKTKLDTMDSNVHSYDPRSCSHPCIPAALMRLFLVERHVSITFKIASAASVAILQAGLVNLVQGGIEEAATDEILPFGPGGRIDSVLACETLSDAGMSGAMGMSSCAFGPVTITVAAGAILVFHVAPNLVDQSCRISFLDAELFWKRQCQQKSHCLANNVSRQFDSHPEVLLER